MYEIDFDAIREEIAIEDVTDLLGLKTHGKRFKCPYQTARYSAAGMTNGFSGTLITKTNAWYCFCGDCNKGGSTLDMVSHYKECSVYEAAVFLGETFHVGLKEITATNNPRKIDTFIKRDVLNLLGLETNPLKPMKLHSYHALKNAPYMDSYETTYAEQMFSNMPSIELDLYVAGTMLWKRCSMWLCQANETMKFWQNASESKSMETEFPGIRALQIQELRPKIEAVSELKNRMTRLLEQEMKKNSMLRGVIMETLSTVYTIEDIEKETELKTQQESKDKFDLNKESFTFEAEDYKAYAQNEYGISKREYEEYSEMKLQAGAYMQTQTIESELSPTMDENELYGVIEEYETYEEELFR